MTVRLARGEAATYARTGTAVAFIISELAGERAERCRTSGGLARSGRMESYCLTHLVPFDHSIE